jgi:hypothetical protein
MISRCDKPRNKNYIGISVCKRWRDDFAAFLEDMGRKPSPLHSIDRINGYGDYEPSNCRWATQSEQHENRRITLRDGGKTLKQISEETGVQYRTIHRRFAKGARGDILRQPSLRASRNTHAQPPELIGKAILSTL